MTRPLRIVNAISDLMRIYSVAFLIPVPFAFFYEPYDLQVLGLALPTNAVVFLASFAILLAYWLPMHLMTRHKNDDDLDDREAYLTVGVGWVALTLFSMVPFLLSGLLPNVVDAFFETMAGLTTTGATTLEGDLDAMPRSLMLWRALLQYIGGMGVIVLGVALLSRLASGGMQLLQAEAPGPTVSRIRPKLAHTASTLWKVYVLFSAVVFATLFLILVVEGHAWTDAVYDAIVHTMTAISTGGFSNHSASVAYFDSVAVEAVLIVTMFVAGSSFTLHWYWLHSDPKRLLRDAEWRVYACALVAAIAMVTVIVAASGTSIGQAFRGGAFTVTSLFSSTGFSTVDFDQWPDAARFLLLAIMFVGGTAGSTAGGLKVVRLLVLGKVVQRAFKKLVHPRAVIVVRLGGKPLKDDTVWDVLAFFFAYITLWMLGTLIITTTDPVLSVVDGASASVSALSNMGPGLGVVGPTQGYWDLLPSSKLVLAFLMWAGRLELFAALLVFAPRAWKT